MKAGRRSFLTYVLLCLLPLLFLAVINYWNGLRLVDRTIGASVQEDLNALTADVDKRVQQHENEIRRLLRSKPVLEFLTSTEQQQSRPEAPSKVAANVAAVLGQKGDPFKLSLFDHNRVLQLQAERPLDASDASGVIVRTADFKPQPFPPDTSEREQFIQVSNTSTWRYAALLYHETNPVRGALLVAELDLAEIFQDRIGADPSKTGDSSLTVVWDKDRRIVYHPQRSLQGQSLSNPFPELADLAGSQGSGLSRTQTGSGKDYLMAYAPLPRLNITVAVGRDRTAAISSAKNWGLAGFVLAVLLAIVMAFIIGRFAQRKSTGLARVNEGLTAVAEGQLDHRVELRSSDDARSMADNLNKLADKMREQYVREAEARQFESFFRLSAMLTHDLKNAIEALSLIVGNMERHFNNEQFRADAMKSLTSATDKLRSLVARLSRPVTSLSGEHKLPRQVDLVPILKRVIKATAEPAATQHAIEVKLPAQLMAAVDVDRIDEVFENLILNGLESMTQKRGTLTIVAEKTANGNASISVSDTGCGISQNFIQESLFRPFRTTKNAGVGLGLYTCREVVAASGGTMEVESTQGVGTTFRVVLPSEVRQQ